MSEQEASRADDSQYFDAGRATAPSAGDYPRNDSEKPIQPLPWHAERETVGQLWKVVDCNGITGFVGVTQDEAEFICRACNCHDELLAALKGVVTSRDGVAWLNLASEHAQRALAAIAKAEANP